MSYPRGRTRGGVKAHIVKAQTANGAISDASTGPPSIGVPRDQPSWNVRYTLRLRLDTGGEESVVVTAPPGGLQLVMRDMTGDHVPNDVVVTPALLHWPLTVLVNDGRQFTVAISGTFPDSASDRDRASSRQGIWDASAFLAGNFETHAASTQGAIVPSLQSEAFLSPAATTVTISRTFGPGSGRAPPSFVTNT